MKKWVCLVAVTSLFCLMMPQSANAQGASENLSEVFPEQYAKAIQGDADAQDFIGFVYEQGFDVERNFQEAVKWYRKAADQGYLDSQIKLAKIYSKGGHGLDKNMEESAKWYRKAAEQGDAFAQNKLGMLYGRGRGVTRDYNESMKWFLKAANQDNTVAMGNIGYMYENGLGVEQDYAEAIKWYRKAADMGDIDAKEKLQELGFE